MRALKLFLLASLGALTVASPAAQAQQTQDQQQQQQQQPQKPLDQSSQPIPAIRSPLAGAADNGDQDVAGNQPLTPDTRSLAGVETLTVGIPATAHRYWLPGMIEKWQAKFLEEFHKRLDEADKNPPKPFP